MTFGILAHIGHLKSRLSGISLYSQRHEGGGRVIMTLKQALVTQKQTCPANQTKQPSLLTGLNLHSIGVLHVLFYYFFSR